MLKKQKQLSDLIVPDRVALTRLLMGVNLVLRQCIQVCASLSGTHTAACSVAGFLLPVDHAEKGYGHRAEANGVLTLSQQISYALIDMSHPFCLLSGRGSKHSK